MPTRSKALQRASGTCPSQARIICRSASWITSFADAHQTTAPLSPKYPYCSTSKSETPHKFMKNLSHDYLRSKVHLRCFPPGHRAVVQLLDVQTIFKRNQVRFTLKSWSSPPAYELEWPLTNSLINKQTGNTCYALQKNNVLNDHLLSKSCLSVSRAEDSYQQSIWMLSDATRSAATAAFRKSTGLCGRGVSRNLCR